MGIWIDLLFNKILSIFKDREGSHEQHNITERI